MNALKRKRRQNKKVHLSIGHKLLTNVFSITLLNVTTSLKMFTIIIFFFLFQSLLPSHFVVLTIIELISLRKL